MPGFWTGVLKEFKMQNVQNVKKKKKKKIAELEAA